MTGSEHLQRNDLDGALQWFQKGLTEFPDDIHSLNGAAVVWLEQGEYELAKRTFEQLIGRCTENEAMRLVLQNNLAYADAMLGGDHLPEADRISKEVYDNASWVPTFKGTRGTVLVELGELDEGIALLTDAMANHETPQSKATCACHLAIAHARKGDTDQARTHLTTAKILDSSCSLLPRAESEISSV